MDLVIEVVIIEDDPMVLELHRQFVNKMRGFKLVGEAGNGKEGIEAILGLKPQLVILDIYMPEGDGIETIKKIRSKGINTDVILVTAAHNPETIQLCMQYGAVDYIIKPFTFQRFKKAMADYLRYIRKIKGSNKLTQEDIDALKGRVVNQSGTETLPKGLDQVTLDQIINIVKKRNGQFTVSEISEAMHVSCVTARRYLKFLHDEGWLTSELFYGVGRPVHKYSIKGDISIS